MSLFPHIDLHGTRQTTLSEKLGVSKQAIGALVDDLEEMGMVERVPDPDDRRAKLVRFSNQGKAGLLDGLNMLKTMETTLAAEIGHDKMAHLHDGLLSLLDALETRGAHG